MSLEESLPVLLGVVILIGCAAAGWSVAGMGTLYKQIGKGGLDVPWLDQKDRDA